MALVITSCGSRARADDLRPALPCRRLSCDSFSFYLRRFHRTSKDIGAAPALGRATSFLALSSAGIAKAKGRRRAHRHKSWDCKSPRRYRPNYAPAGVARLKWQFEYAVEWAGNRTDALLRGTDLFVTDGGSVTESMGRENGRQM